MRCYDCGNEYIEKVGPIDIIKKPPMAIEARYYECEGCGKKLFPRETALTISELRGGSCISCGGKLSWDGMTCTKCGNCFQGWLRG